MNYDDFFATRTSRMGASAIREILKVLAQPGMVSLAGGIPAPESFPMEVLQKLCDKVIKDYGSQAFQYTESEGIKPLREALVGYVEKKNINTKIEEVVVTSGSQGLLDGCGKILISKGDKIAVESPTYLGALQAFNPYEPKYVSMETDDDGLIPDSLEKTLTNHDIKFIYLVPTFQNPTGRTLTLKRREKIAEIIKKHDALLIEDDPYGELRYRGNFIPPIKSMAHDNVIYTSTLSKVFAPGLRIGFSIAPEPITHWLVLARQGVDLHSSTFNQYLAAEYISGGHIYKQIKKNIELYRPRQEAMMNALEKYFPKEFKSSKPEGGMFIWVEGPKGFDAEKAYWKGIERKVAFVPGKFFFAEKGQGLETMRLNYSMVDEKTIDSAVKTLSEVVKKEV